MRGCGGTRSPGFLFFPAVFCFLTFFSSASTGAALSLLRGFRSGGRGSADRHRRFPQRMRCLLFRALPGSLALARVSFGQFGRNGHFFNRTPMPLPLVSGRNSTPAASRVSRRLARLLGCGWRLPRSKSAMVACPWPEALARSDCDQFRRARAARHCSGVRLI